MQVGKPVTISIDAMGGDHAPEIVIDGVRLAHVRLPHVRYLLFGDAARIEPLLARYPDLQGVCTVRHTDEVVTMDAKPGQVLRTGRRSSMWLAVDAVAKGDAAGVVSAGNTGALMAVSKFVLRPLPGIDRPAIAGMFPTERGETVMLDLGANVDCDSDNLVQFALMGEVFARAVLGLEKPSVGLLNIGSEDMKGNDAVRAAAVALREGNLPIRFHGFVEGNDICAGTVDVVVTDGFTGNIALKTAEGTAKFFSSFMRQAFQNSFLAKIGFLFAKQALNKVKMRTDPRRYNGAMFLGLGGIAVKSHGGTDAFGFSNAVGVAVDLVSHGYNERIRKELEHLQQFESGARASVAAGS